QGIRDRTAPIGHLLMQGLEDELARAEVERRVACVITRVAVSADDPQAFARPTQPIGPFFTAEEADHLRRTLGWNMREDAGRGWRYVVASPRPKRILDLDVIAALAAQGVAVIAAGGGGIPMVARADEFLRRRAGGGGRGPHVGTPCARARRRHAPHPHRGAERRRRLRQAGRPAGLGARDRLRTLPAYDRDGHFAAGSMAPKVEAALWFLARGGKRAVIAHLDDALAAFEGARGTQVFPG
ncbi:MAG: carbamate kinase, partial [Burkholderiales bacterium]|nr:carbamate kinase [Burkholderiales bacterium]